MTNSATYLHVIGADPEIAVPVIAQTTPGLHLTPRDITWVEVTERSRWAVAVATPGISDAAYFIAPLSRVAPGATRWRKVVSSADNVTGVVVHGDRLYALTYLNAPNFRIVALDLPSGGLERAKDIVPESKAVLVKIAVARDAMYVLALDRGMHQLSRVPWGTNLVKKISLPFAGSIRRLVSDPESPGLAFSIEGWTRQPSWFHFDPATGMSPISIYDSPARPAVNEGFIAEQATVLSRGNAEVPLSIIRRADRSLDGTAPALISAYGAYGAPTTPVYNPFPLTWARRGGIYAICHVRGGGEKGKTWHLAGIKRNKENGVDDLIACADYLIKKRYTTSGRLTAIGTSAGGIVVGGAITKRPELLKAAVLRVPVVNLVRNEVTAVGPANTAEYGALSVEEEFRSILASDPYHRVRRGVGYPAVLLTAGLQDPRVPVWQPAKFAARLQAESGARLALLRVESDAGHGPGSTETQREEELADIYAFALWQAEFAVK